MDQNPTSQMSTSSPDTVQRPLAKPLVFIGQFRPLLDQKKRLTIPARWRPEGMEELFIVKSTSRRCLSALPEAVLQEMGEKARSQSATMEAHQAFMDQLFSQAVICPVDSQGRMVLSDDLCGFAGIEKEVVLAGSGSKFDLWCPPEWEKQQQAAAPNYATLLKSIGL
jgi:MraZ protein